MTAQGKTMKSVPDYNELYATEDGRIFHNKKELKQETTIKGYKVISFKQNDRWKIIRVHRLVCAAYHGKPFLGAVTRHLDGKRDNNHFSNLKWGTHKENVQDAMKHGTHACRKNGKKSALKQILKGKSCETRRSSAG